MKRKDPRAEIVDGSLAIELSVSARVDTLTSMRDYFAEIYGNDQLGFDIRKVSIATLVDWNKKHIDFYNEATRLMESCIEDGFMFDPEQVKKLRDYHLDKAQMLAGVIESRQAKKEAVGDSAS